MAIDATRVMKGALSASLLNSAVLHHGFELPVADEQPVRMAGQFREVPLLIEPLGGVGETIEYDGDEGEGVACLVAFAERLCQQRAAEPLALPVLRDPEPRENSDGQRSAGKLSGDIVGQVAEVDLASGEGVIADDPIPIVEKNLRYRTMLLLVLPSLGAKPIVDCGLAAAELPPPMIPL